MEKSRDESIDRLRGLSIVTMFYAHLIPHYVNDANSIYLFERIISSFAAPMFLFLVGYNFNAKQSFTRLAKRAYIIFLFASIVDIIIWQIYPFYSFDILYTIGFSLFFLQITRNFKSKYLVEAVIILFISPFIIELFSLYSIEINEPQLNQSYHFVISFKNLLINGWFPLFPWLIFPMIGFIFQRINSVPIIIKLLSSFIFSIVFLASLFFVYQVRPNTVEIFYPASAFCLFLGCVFVSTLWINRGILGYNFFSFLTELGKCSLLMYIFHLACYEFFGIYLFQLFPNRLIGFFLSTLFFVLIAFQINKNKKKWTFYTKSEFIQIFLGR